MSPMPLYKYDDDDGEDIVHKNIDNSKEKIIVDKPKYVYTTEQKTQNSVTSSYVSFTRINMQNTINQNTDRQISISDLYGTLNDSEENVESNEEINETFRNISYDIIGDVTIQTNLSLISQLDMSTCGAPLPIFTEVNCNLNLLFKITNFY